VRSARLGAGNQSQTLIVSWRDKFGVFKAFFQRNSLFLNQDFGRNNIAICLIVGKGHHNVADFNSIQLPKNFTLDIAVPVSYAVAVLT
jgi:hypothetical protein